MRRIAAGAEVLPPAPAIFTALRLTPLETVRVVILGQDPYPTPGDAHGLAFSYRRRAPAAGLAARRSWPRWRTISAARRRRAAI